jgi:hypothetical protein
MPYLYQLTAPQCVGKLLTIHVHMPKKSLLQIAITNCIWLPMFLGQYSGIILNGQPVLLLELLDP